MIRNGSASARKNIRISLYKKQKGLCKLCKEPFEAIFLTIIDHKIPIALGGKDDHTNIRLLCIQCNNDKTRQDMINIRDSKKSNLEYNMRLHKEKHSKNTESEEIKA